MDIQPPLLRRMSARRILEVLQDHGPSTRADITRRSGISAPTVSKVVASLLESSLLEEGDVPAGTFGRPARLLQLASRSARVLGVVLDVPTCHVVDVGLDGALDERRSREFVTPRTYRGLIDAVVRHVDVVCDDGVSRLGVGICTPGLIHVGRQEVLMSPNLPITNGRSPARDLTRRLGVESVMCHESHALCLAERGFGGARGLDDFAMLDVSTGLGLGVFSGGQFLEGKSGLAGELGHVTFDPGGRACGCGNRGCLETLATDTAFATGLSERLGRRVDVDAAIALVAAGRATARGELDRVCEYLASASAAVINLFNPSTLFVHGRVLDARDGVFDLVRDRARECALKPSFDDCSIVQAQGNKRLGAVAGIVEHLTDALGPKLR